MKLCACNACGRIYEDLNPQVDALEYPDTIPVRKLVWLSTEIGNPETDYIGCPICCTDGFLTDIVENHIEKNMVELMVGLILYENKNDEMCSNLVRLITANKE